MSLLLARGQGTRTELRLSWKRLSTLPLNRLSTCQKLGRQYPKLLILVGSGTLTLFAHEDIFVRHLGCR